MNIFLYDENSDSKLTLWFIAFRSPSILDFQMYDPLFYYKMIGMFGKSDTLAHIHVEKFGYGIQNLILISLFQTYAEIFKNKIILAIEEPEA